ncbi:hypothetical protein MJO28_000922 [Puccinia striiformis f. sp. tritici]|uniref:Uncharacterized protein n=1 Tax=Puccinia striiformis f. sp. tritici TaxID=168172 RepID=A0ACC0F1Z6_9BASI|nr:hypothetical protein MJO28_000922 [Puccinia striiformis f. sp. tritici]KAI7967062.1 hypothetical protein MJO29_000339 [Puccinia striiformis f. sp. tritici]
MATGDYPLQGASVPKANRFRNVTLGHLDNLIGGNYKHQNSSSVLYKARDGSKSVVHLEAWSAAGRSKPSFAEAAHQHYTRISTGFKFGPSWTNHWVRAIMTAPKHLQEKERVQFEFDPGCEAMVYSSEGLPLQGLTGGTNDLRRVEFIIPRHSRMFPLKIYIEVSANGWCFECYPIHSMRDRNSDQLSKI